MFWTIIIAGLFVAGLIFRHNFRSEDRQEEAGEDAGLAIVEFGRAFPEEAIRAVVTTKDRRTVFLRLHDGKAGCMQAHGHHYACHLIEPGTVRVNSAGPRRLTVEYANAAFEGGTYEFRDEKEAAEVSLWLLGSFMPGAANLNAQPAG